MTQEELKLALEELADSFSQGWHEGIKIDASDIMLVSKATQALAQPQRTWIGLTDWEINSVATNNNPLDGIRTFARAIEAKLKELNT